MSYDPYTDPLNTLTDLPMTSQAIATALIGPWFAGWIFHLFLFGLVQSQFAAYTSTELYGRDPLRTKLLLWAVVLLDFADVFVNASQMFHFGTAQERDYASLYATRSIDSVPNLLCAAIAALVQVFLLRRACTLFNHNLLHRWIFVGTIAFVGCMSFLACCGAFALGILWSFGSVERALPFTYNNLSSTWLWTSLAVDIALCLSLVVLLRKRFVGGDSHTSVRKLISLSVQTASMTTILGLAGAIVSAFPQSNNSTANVAFAFALPLPSLYVLSLIVTLASRKQIPVTVTGNTTVLRGAKRDGEEAGGLRLTVRGETMLSEKKRQLGDLEGDDDDEDDENHFGPSVSAEMGPAFVDLRTTAAFSIREPLRTAAVVGPGLTLSVNEEDEAGVERVRGGAEPLVGAGRVQWATDS